MRVVIHNVIARPIEGGGQPALRDCKSHRVSNTLTQRTRRDSRTWHHTVFGVARGAAAPLAKLLFTRHREVVTGEEQQAVEQHAGMPGGQHKTIAIEPFGVGGLCRRWRVHKTCAIGAAPNGIPGWMSRVRFLDCVDRQRPDGVDARLVNWLSYPWLPYSGRCASANPARYWLRSPSNACAMAAAEPVNIDSSDMSPVQPVWWLAPMPAPLSP